MSEEKKVSEMTPQEIKDEVKKAYSKVAARDTCCTSSCCSGPPSSERQELPEASCCSTQPREAKAEVESDCCSDSQSSEVVNYARSLGYDLSDLPDAARESFAGCGNPVALAELREGEVVLDLGSGAGLDAFVAAKKVGETGQVIGVDMTPKMLDSARKSATEMSLNNIEFREGDIEQLPVQDNSIDVVISNCVINLATDKARVFEESYRVLRPGGRLMVSDIVLNKKLSRAERDDIANYTGCLGGAILEGEYLQHIRDAGFEEARVTEKEDWGRAVSVRIRALKPKA